MVQKVLYVVGSKIVTLLDNTPDGFFTVPTDGPSFNTPILPVFYKDTRNLLGYGGSSDIFTSSTDPNWATKYENYEDAVKWNEEFLHGEGVVYRF